MDLLTIKEVAKRLRVSVPTVRRMLRKDQFQGRAVRAGHQWRIPAGALFPTTEYELRPRWVKTMLLPGSSWEMVDQARMASFVEQLVSELHPRFIIIGVRKGERIIAALQLIPAQYRPTVYHIEYFRLMPEDERRRLLENSTVLLLDDTMQRGRSLRLQREWLMRQAPNVRVYVACLFVRAEVRSRQDMEVPDVVAYQELDGPSYRLATAELSRVHRSLWPLDESHPIVWTVIPNSVSEEQIVTVLAKLGRLLELPVPVVGADMRVLVVDGVVLPSWQNLGLPKTASDWPNKKLRYLWLRESRHLVVAGIWFPSLRATPRWLASQLPARADPWYPYLSTQDSNTWRKLTPEQQALSMFRAWAIYSGVRLICAALGELARECPDALPKDGQLWSVEDEDFIRVYGESRAKQMIAAIRAEVLKEVSLGGIAAQTSKQIPLQEARPTPVMGDEDTIHDLVTPLVQLLGQKARAWERTHSRDEEFPGLSWQELRGGVGTDIGHVLDLTLDYGFGKPRDRVRWEDTVIEVDRAYGDAEPNPDEVEGPATDGMLLEQRILTVVPVLCSNFESFNPGNPLEQLVFNKLLVNLQANLATGAINPPDTALNRTFVKEKALIFGPMAYTPEALTVANPIPVVTFLAKKGVIRDPYGKDGRPRSIVLITPASVEDSLARFQYAWSALDEKMRTDIRLLCKLYGEPSHGKGMPTKGNLLTALGACSSEPRFLYYSYADVNLWREHAQCVLNRIREKVYTGQLQADPTDDVDNMLRAGASLSDKVGWYKNVQDWRAAIEKCATGPDLTMAKIRLLSRIEKEPRLGPGDGPRFVLMIEPVVRVYGTLLRFAVSKAGLIAGTLAKQSVGAQPCFKFKPHDPRHDLCNFAEACIALRTQGPVEIEASAAALDKLGGLSDEDTVSEEVVSSLMDVWRVLEEITRAI